VACVPDRSGGGAQRELNVDQIELTRLRFVKYLAAIADDLTFLVLSLQRKKEGRWTLWKNHVAGGYG
jgi:hypothetical protein